MPRPRLRTTTARALAAGLAVAAWASTTAVAGPPVARPNARASQARPAAATPAFRGAAGTTPADPCFPRPVQLQHVRRLVLDPGHGGDNQGAVGVLGIREKAVALDVARAMAAYVRAHSNVTVLLTRDADSSLGLRDRPRLANELQGDAFVSVHANAHETSEAHGMEVFFLAADSSVETNRHVVEADEGIHPEDQTATLPWSVDGILAEMDLAAAHSRSQAFAAAMAEALRKVRPTVRFRGVRQAAFGVLKEARMPALVLELGYLTHPLEGRTLVDPAVHEQFARALLLSLVELDRVLAAERKPAPPVAPVKGKGAQPQTAQR